MAHNNSMQDNYWDTSITELIMIFRDSLISLIPILQRAKITVGIDQGYDAWDDISETLFNNIVVESIRWALPENEMLDFKLSRYEMTYEDYFNISFI